jgi:hypothetical protein
LLAQNGLLTDLQLLEGIGVFKNLRGRRSVDSYQASVTAPLDRAFDEEIGGDDDDDDGMPTLDPVSDYDDELSKAVGKVDFDSDSDNSLY